MWDIFRKIILALVAFSIVVLFFFGYTYATKNMPMFVTRFLGERIGGKISVGHVRIGFPLCVELKDVRINDYVDIKKAQVYPNLATLFFKNKTLVSSVKIVEPVVKLGKEKKKDFLVADFLDKNESSYNEPGINFRVSSIDIKNGTLIYDGEKDGLEIVNIKGSVKNPGIFFADNNICQFAVAGFLKNKESDFLSPVKIEGLVGTDNVVKARLLASDVKPENLGPVYTKYLSKLIEGGRVDIKSDMQVSGKNLVAKCSLEGEDIFSGKEGSQGSEAPLKLSFVLLANFSNKLVKIKDLQSNFFKLIFSES